MALLCIYHIVYARLRRVKRTSKNVGAAGHHHHRDAGSALLLFGLKAALIVISRLKPVSAKYVLSQKWHQVSC
jgi:hypothetical protein